MSEYMRIKAEIEKLQSGLEAIRVKELNERVEDIRKQIIAWELTPEQLFPHDPRLQKPVPGKRVRKRSRPPAGTPRYRLRDYTWAGTSGPQPKWVTDYLSTGGVLTQIEIGADGKTALERANGGR